MAEGHSKSLDEAKALLAPQCDLLQKACTSGEASEALGALLGLLPLLKASKGFNLPGPCGAAMLHAVEAFLANGLQVEAHAVPGATSGGFEKADAAAAVFLPAPSS